MDDDNFLTSQPEATVIDGRRCVTALTRCMLCVVAKEQSVAWIDGHQPVLQSHLRELAQQAAAFRHRHRRRCPIPLDGTVEETQSAQPRMTFDELMREAASKLKNG